MARGRKETRLGRPAEFTARVRLTVLLEARELVALRKLADRAGISASRYVRGLIQANIPRAGGD